MPTSVNGILKSQDVVLEKTLNLAKVAGDYDAFTATGDCYIKSYVMYVSIAGATFDTVSVQTNDTTGLELLSIVEGDVSELTEGRNLKASTTPFRLSSGKKIQYTISGSTGTGQIRMAIIYSPISSGATIA